MNHIQLIQNLKDKIDQLDITPEVHDVGKVIEVHDGIVRISGLSLCQAGEMLEFDSGQIGVALNLENEAVGAIVIGDFTTITEGMIVKRTKKILTIPVGNNVLGRVVNPLGEVMDGRGDIKTTKNYLIERIAAGVMDREPVSQPVQTGLKAIDAMIPIGRGQRELIIGDRQTGKTTVAIDTILNQKGQDIICVYVAIGQKKSKIARLVETLAKGGALEYTAVVAAGASDGAALSYLAPYAGVAMAEFFMDQGKDVLIVYDDLSKHAVAYREISLLLRRPPGREAYPGDVFYLHSRLLERAVRRSPEAGGGSITALPIIETQAGDISAYIPTNVISITDGQIFLETALFNKGVRPAINVGQSVSRVGSAAQIKSMKKVASSMKLNLAQYREFEAFSQFASDLDQETKKILDRGRRLTELLKQPPNQPLAVAPQVVLMYAANHGHLDQLAVEEIGAWEKALLDYLKLHQAKLLEEVTGGWDEKIENKVKQALGEFAEQRIV